jgi:Uncharacterized protein, homolog of Cu resistance protein CopC
MSRLLRAGVVGAVAAGLVLAVAAPAAAHSWVVASTPAEGEVLTELPETWEVVANETLLYVGNDEVFGLVVRDSEGLYYGDGCVDVVGPRMAASPSIGEPGDYTLVYAFVSGDGHPLTGEIPFTWAPTEDTAPAPGSADVPRCDVVVGQADEPAASAGVPPEVWWIGGALLGIVVAIAGALGLARIGRATDAGQDT